ncbi:glycoside hydrolase family 13 protein [Winogradskyella alexanderae]|uniref:Glycoside hydrolase family 13 protein n=1 Tax=Winogradskyella alexanderae TaxID=2877123 RepID=A0ABS7XRD5_9FLAO|nr:glycoside hydrolase family 13 protein [Winogradskyella alexanderae]MCA0132571.1 glycoside hydrolase family 13 protein [Winogradskyella alexanderae]
MIKLKQPIFCFVLFLVFSCNNQNQTTSNSSSQEVMEIKNDINKIEPPNWWVGFKSEALQLLVHHAEIGSYTPEISYSGISIEKVHKANSPNYLFLDLQILETAQPGKFNITFKKENADNLVQTYELKEREKSAEDYLGFDSSDAIFLITPDRFANADPSNDIIETMNEKDINRNDGYARHGGDIKGIIEHIGYIKNLGFTTVWPCPLLTNDMPQGSYHGYAITDYYEVDPRFGSNQDYRVLADELRSNGMKLIMDQVANHCGLEHWWMKDLPFKDWVNYQEHYEANINNWNGETVKRSSHRRTTNQDAYASKKDKSEMTDGWFVYGMPDLNQRNPFMANYIIQNSIWWIETLGLGGIRQDTYPYPDKQFMSDWAGSIMNEYPNFNIVGEEWSSNPLLIAYWQDGHANPDGYNSNLRSTMDFAMQEKVVAGLKNEETWGTGLKEIYVALANDFSYTRPEDILVFPDNHDMSRIFTQLDGDITNTKMALSYMAVLPRTFQMYYGTEILMDDFDNPGDHGLIRTDFPGGWEGDVVNAFTGENLEPEKRKMQTFISKLLNYRKDSKAIHSGETVHFAPENNTYVLVRYNKDETVVHIMNKNEKAYDLDLQRFDELQLNGKTLKNIITGETIVWEDSIKLSEKGSVILTTKI